MGLLALGNLLCIVLLLWLVFRKSGTHADAEKAQQAQLAQQAIQAEQTQRHQATLDALTATQAALQQANERLERELRREITESSRGGRQELTQSLATFQQTLVAQSSEATRTQNTQIDAFGQQLTLLQKTLSDTLALQVTALSESNARRLAELRATLESQLAQLQSTNAAKLEEVAESSRKARVELSQSFSAFQSASVAQGGESAKAQSDRIDSFGLQLGQHQKSLTDTLATQVSAMAASNGSRLNELRQTLETQLTQLQAGNAAKLDEMRATVDEKLQSTLQARIGESFKQVADRLEQVHKGLGEMQNLATGVGDLKHLLSNVKTRGTFGEEQLGALLEQTLVREQYEEQVMTRPGSGARVDFAVKMPGQSVDGKPVWVPIDAKFPNEDYERLLDAHGRADAIAAEIAGKALESRIKLEAKSIEEKYIEPPFTTNFAILYLPSEGLYAEVLRRPGLWETLRRQYRITLAGPTTLHAILNSLQMGFRTLAVQKQSSEVWQVLGAVKTEFGKFGGMLEKAKTQAQTVVNTLAESATRTKAMDRALRKAEALPDEQSQVLLPLEKGAGPDADEG